MGLSAGVHGEDLDTFFLPTAGTCQMRTRRHHGVCHDRRARTVPELRRP